MADASVTKEQLINAARDADDLAAVVNDAPNRPNPGHPAGTVTTRQGRTIRTISNVVESQVTQETAAAASAQQARDARNAIFALSSANSIAARAKLKGRNGFAIDAETDLVGRAVAVVGGGKDFDGSLRDWFPKAIFPYPKIITARDGAAAWSQHNAIYSSNDPTTADWIMNQVAIVAAATPAGAMFRVSATGANSYLTTSDVSLGVVDSPAGTVQTDAIVLRFDNNPIVVLGRGGNGSGVWFDLANGEVLTATGGLIGAMSSTEADGTVLPPGTWLCSITGPKEVHRLAIAAVDADNSWNSTAGKAVLIARPRGHLGATPLPYLVRPAYANGNPPISVGVPYDWSRLDANGNRLRRVLIDLTDNVVIPGTLFPNPGSIYFEGEFEDIGPNNEQVIFTVTGNDGSLVYFSRDRGGDTFRFVHYKASATPVSGFVDLGTKADICAGNAIAFATQLQSGKVSVASCGDIAGSLYRDIAVASDIRMGGFGGQQSHRFYLKTIIGLTDVVTDFELAEWQDAQRLNAAVVSSAFIVRNKNDFGVDHGTRARECTVTKLGETPTRAYLLATSHQKWGETEEGHHQEAPTRLLYRLFEVERSKGRIVAATPIAVFDQPPGWAQGKGHMLGRCGVKLRTGARRGQTLCIWTVLTSANQTFDPTYDTTIYGRYLEDNGRGVLPARFEVTSSAALKATRPETAYLVTDPSGSMVEFPSDSPWPGRVVFVAYNNDGTNLSFYSDQQGAAGSWQASPYMPKIAAYGHNESNLIRLPNNWLLNINRVLATADGTEPRNKRTANISTDGGATWGPAIDMSATFIGAQVSGGIDQVDPDYVFGTFGRVAYARAIEGDGYGRNASLISHYMAASLLPVDSFYAQPRGRGCGYSSLVSLWGGEFYALAVEIANRVGQFNDIAGSSTALKIIDPVRGLKNNPA